jgi:hypothetical protein
MIVTEGIPAGVYPCKTVRIDEDRHIDIFQVSNGYAVEIYNGPDIAPLGLSTEAAIALWTGLGMWLEG